MYRKQKLHVDVQCGVHADKDTCALKQTHTQPLFVIQIDEKGNQKPTHYSITFISFPSYNLLPTDITYLNNPKAFKIIN